MEEWIEVGAEPKQVNRNDRLGPRGDRRSHRAGVDVVRQGIDIHEHRPGTKTSGAAGGRKEGIGARDDLVARPDTERHHRHEQPVRPRRDADRVPDPEHHGQLALEELDLPAEDELLTVAHPRHRRDELIPNRRVLSL